MLDEPVPDYSGREIGNWRLLRRLGVGSFGAVYEAQNQAIDKQAAVKVLHPQWAINQEVVGRFLKEASAASKARHRGVVEFYDGGFSADRLCYMVMELCHGGPLTALLQRGPLGPQRTARLGARLADALEAVHRQQVVHRDLKPDNILIEEDARAGEIPKILDFGIAKLRAGPKQTTDGQMLGTPEYMSPEQCLALADIDHRADIYSLGVVLFQCLTGALPFAAENLYGYLFAHINHTPPAPRGLRPDTPPALEQLLLRMLAKAPADRPASMEQVRDALEAIEQRGAAGRSKTRLEGSAEKGGAGGQQDHLVEGSEEKGVRAVVRAATLRLDDKAPAPLTLPALAPSHQADTARPAQAGTARTADGLLARSMTLPPPPGPAGLRLYAGVALVAALLGVGAWTLSGGGRKPLVVQTPRPEPAAGSVRTARPTGGVEAPPSDNRGAKAALASEAKGAGAARPLEARPVVRAPLPAELVAVGGRALSRGQISIGEFRAFAERTGLRPPPPSKWPWENRGSKIPEALPMISVPAAQAARYCEDRYRALGGRLPTAAELTAIRAAQPAAPMTRPEEWLHEGPGGDGNFKTSFRCSAALEERSAP